METLAPIETALLKILALECSGVSAGPGKRAPTFEIAAERLEKRGFLVSDSAGYLYLRPEGFDALGGFSWFVRVFSAETPARELPGAFPEAEPLEGKDVYGKRFPSAVAAYFYAQGLSEAGGAPSGFSVGFRRENGEFVSVWSR